MKINDINREELLSLLLNKKHYSIGCNGVLTLKNDKLYKIYYNDFLKTFRTKDEEIFDSEIKSLRIKRFVSKNPKRKLKVLKRLLDTKINNLITGVLSYNGLLVGIEMNYLKDYITLEKALLSISMNEYDEFVDHFFEKCNELVDDLLKNGIAPYDVNEDNVLVNMSTKDITLVDLDDDSTKYMSKKYILKHSYIGYNVKTFVRIHDCIEDIEFMRMNDK